METSDFKTFTEVVVAKLGNSTGAYATVLDVMIGPGATGDSLTAVINSEGDKTVQFYSSTDGGQVGKTFVVSSLFVLLFAYSFSSV